MTRVVFGNPRSGDIHLDDLAEAVTLLEQERVVSTWSLSRIRNPKHAVFPVGPGFGVMVVHTFKIGEPIHVWEKAGVGTIKDAVTSAIKRLKGQIDRRNRDSGGL